MMDNKIDNRVERILQLLQQETEELFDALEKSKNWPAIKPELAAAIAGIETEPVFSNADISLRLKDKVTEEDLLNLNGFLYNQISWKYLNSICENWPKASSLVIELVYFRTAAAAAWQRLQGSIPVKRAFAELVPLANRGEINLQTTTQAGRDSHGLKQPERAARNEVFQQEINQLCLGKRGMTYNGALKFIVQKGVIINGQTATLSFTQLKRITKNPKPK